MGFWKLRNWVLSFLALLLICPIHGAATQMEEAGTYTLDAKLSCYVSAMGGVEFGEPLLTDARLTIDQEGREFITLSLGKSSVTIYSVTCDTFLDAAPGGDQEAGAIPNGTIGYYDAQGQLVTEGVQYTLSQDTALNPANEAVHYVDSITFPILQRQETYRLALYVNSNVMGVQFGQGYAAQLQVNWDGERIPQSETTPETAPTAREMEGLSLYPGETLSQPVEEATNAQKAAGQPNWLLAALGVALIAGGTVVVATAGEKKEETHD